MVNVSLLSPTQGVRDWENCHLPTSKNVVTHFSSLIFMNKKWNTHFHNISLLAHKISLRSNTHILATYWDFNGNIECDFQFLMPVLKHQVHTIKYFTFKKKFLNNIRSFLRALLACSHCFSVPAGPGVVNQPVVISGRSIEGSIDWVNFGLTRK